jgi:hypothetical protein
LTLAVIHSIIDKEIKTKKKQMQTELINLSTGLKNVYPPDWAMLYDPKTRYKKLVEVVKKTKTQITIKGETKYNISTGKIVPSNPNHAYLLRALTLEEIDDINRLEAREFIICDIKENLHSLDIDSLTEMAKAYFSD